jgi:hypothetical protein
MATIKTYDLIQCSGLYPTIPSAYATTVGGLEPYNGSYVRLNADEEQTYFVKSNEQARFLHPAIPGVDEKAVYSVTSMKVNGIEALAAPSNLTVLDTNLLYTDYPNYVIPNEYTYTNGVANAVIIDDSVSDLGNGVNNFFKHLQAVADANNVKVQVKKTPDDWWGIDGFDPLNNFSLEKKTVDMIEIGVTVSIYDNSDVLISEQENIYLFDSGSVTHTIDGSPAVSDLPQTQDEASFYRILLGSVQLEAAEACPFLKPFCASIDDEGCSTLATDCDCSKISFSDTSNYNNGLVGHDSSFFNYRKITLTRPDGTTYIWSTDSGTDVDEVIQPHYNSSNQFSYSFLESDKDGLYSIELCSFPDWQTGIFYDKTLNNIVYRNGVLYKQVASSNSVDPATDTNNDYWIELSDTDDTGRYCCTEKILVLCIKILSCYKKLVDASMCAMENDPCKNLCENDDMMKAMKMRVTMDAVDFAYCAKKYDLTKKHMEILNSLCCCNGGC